ncbi:luciferase [Natronorubrum sp. A-ect3]|uniref:DUF7388 family protein n=1 Tax=Natronorubrum sp. A-ect3 TaxID=3242698 RepID=UPI00359D9710
MLTTSTVARAGLDAIALKPAECDLSAAASIPVETIAIDYEGRDHLPSHETLTALADDTAVLLTTPVRVDGFDPLGDDSLVDELPDAVGRVLVAGHGAYLTDEERERSIAPRLDAALETDPDAWVGTESVERLAMATGATQYELLARRTAAELQALRAVGFEGEIALYAPTVLTDDDDIVLDAVGDYVSRRRPVARALPEDAATDASATGRAREVLLKAARDYALIGEADEIREQTDMLHEAGVTTIVGYPAQGLEPFLE